MTHLDPEARRIVSLARAARTPSTTDKQRVRRRIALAAAGSIAAGAGVDVAHATQGAAAVKAVGFAGSVKLYVVGAVIVLAGAAGYALVPAPVLIDRPAPAPTLSDVAAPNATGADGASAEATRVAEKVESEPSSDAAPRGAPPPSAAGKRAAAGKEIAKRSRGAPPLRAAGDSAELVRELDLLHGAQAAWRDRDARKTLALLDQHAREYPKSELREERGGLRVLALCELGRRAEARRVADALTRRAPRSPVLATIEESCAFR